MTGSVLSPRQEMLRTGEPGRPPLEALRDEPQTAAGVHSRAPCPQGRHRPCRAGALPSKGGNPHPHQTRDEQPHSSPGPPSLGAELRQCGRPDPGQEAGRAAWGWDSQNKPCLPVLCETPKPEAGLQVGAAPDRQGAGVRGWTAAGWHGTGLTGGAEQAGPGHSTHSLSFRSHGGHLQLLLPAGGTGNRHGARARTPCRVGVGHTG